jgi:uncharacterized membrane protein
MAGPSGLSFLIGSTLVAASSKGAEFGVGLILWMVAGTIITILLVPFFYRRALRRKGAEANLRQFLMQDEKAGEALREHYEKKKSPSNQPAKPTES